jgi:hypothetical protein
VCRHAVTPDRVTIAYFRRRCRGEGRSKAIISGLTDGGSALSSERVYVLRTLPGGILRGLRDLLRGDPGGAARAWRIVEGTVLTTAAYIAMRVRLTTRVRLATPMRRASVPPTAG